MKKKDRGKDTDKTKRPLAYGEEYVRDYMSGMEALGEAIEQGKVKLEEGDASEWAEKKVERNCEGDVIAKQKLKPVKLTKEQLQEALGNRKKNEEEEMEEDEGEEGEEGEEDEENEEDEELLEGDEEEEEMEGDEEEEEEMEEEGEEEESEKEKTEEEMTPEEREQLRQQRIAKAREVLSTRILSPKDFRILQGKDDSDDDSDESEEEDVEVANARHHSSVVNPSDLLGYHKKRKDSIEVCFYLIGSFLGKT